MIQENSILESSIFNHIMNVLDNNRNEGHGHGHGHYIRFDSRKEKEAFTKYIWKKYQNYIQFMRTTNTTEKEKYMNKYRWYSHAELNALFDANANNERQRNLCLFYDAIEYPEGRFFENELDSKNHWLLRIGHGGGNIGSNFKNSSRFNVWGVKRPPNGGDVTGFEFLVKRGDILWFIPGGTDGYVLACAEYVGHCEIDHTNRHQRYSQLGWNSNGGSSDWNVEIHYKDLKYTSKTETVDNTLESMSKYCTHIKGNSVNVRIYDRDNREKCRIELPRIYSEIVNTV
jgi:hypothetical protein